jgi:hypothetical protein
MSTPARVRGASPSASPLAPEDLRRQLEGRLELIEDVLSGYRRLEAALKHGQGWRRRLRAETSCVAGVLERDAACLEAMERAVPRAEVEGWPKDSPVLGTVREARECRARLQYRVRELLASLVSVPEDSSLVADLRRLEALVRDPVSFAKQPGESFGHVMQSEAPFVQNLLHVLCWLGLVALGCFTFGLLVRGHYQEAIAGGLMTAGGLALLKGPVARWLRTGVVWFTPQRLVWMPSRDEPVAVRLESIPDGGIRLEGRGLRVEGDRHAWIPRLGRTPSRQLRLWLEMFRHPVLRSRCA